MSSTDGLADEHRLEAALERGVLLDVLAVLVERGGADGAQLPAGEHRLEHVAGVHRALRGAGADDRVQLVDEHDDLALGVGDLLQHRLQAVLKLPSVLRAGDHRTEVERDELAVAQALGHVAVHDPLGKALDDRGLPDARLADQHGIVLGAPAQHLDHAPDLVVAPDHRVELALLRGLCQVAAEALQRLQLVLGVLVGHVVRAADLLERLQQLLLGRPCGAQRVAGIAGVTRDREQQVLGGDVLVAQLAHLVLRGAKHLDELARAARGLGRGALAAQLRQRVEGGAQGLANGRRVNAELAQHRDDDPFGLLEQHRE